MSIYRADLHIHSRFSRATSKKLTARHLAAWAGAKGIAVLGTGDITHPVWQEELRRELEFDEASGLYRLRRPLERADIAAEIPELAGVELQAPLFMLQSEISSIYKKGGQVRKVHNLVYLPNFAAMDNLSASLGAIGNLKSDGRPILGLDSRHLLELVLEIPGAALIPAHIWTPWFALFGSKSGFNSLEECFDDLAGEIFAAETGLSSDPDMNRCWSHLDRITLVSNSDAHSGENLGREATLFHGRPGYQAIFDALRGKSADFGGTLEFFPDEGKYFLDGHRNCNVVLKPLQSRELGDICPVCGRPLTVGVLHRVMELADRSEPEHPGRGFVSLIPLAEILGELLDCGPKTKKVREKQADLQGRFGSELDILLEHPLGDLSAHWPEFGEAISRMRAGRVIRQGGFDGEYGVIRLFEPGELGKPGGRKIAPNKKDSAAETFKLGSLLEVGPQAAPLADLPGKSNFEYTPAQNEAIRHGAGPLLVLAGPGSGKTRTLVARVEQLLADGVPAGEICVVTFSRRAAQEVRERLQAISGAEPVRADTLHSLALDNWRGAKPVVLGEEDAKWLFKTANPQLEVREADQDYQALNLGRELLRVPERLAEAARNYHLRKQERNLADYTDLLERWILALDEGQERPWSWLLVDEVQDLSPLQIELLRLLLPGEGTGFFGIGDPDQAIYGFRGSQPDIEQALREKWPALQSRSLSDSFRAPQAILDAASKVLGDSAACGRLDSRLPSGAYLHWLQAPDARQEQEWICKHVSRLLGGTSHSQADRQSVPDADYLPPGSCSPGDIAILVRLKALMPELASALRARGIPVATPQLEGFWRDERVGKLLEFFVAPELLEPKDVAELGLAPEFADRLWDKNPERAARELAENGHPEFDELFLVSTPFKQLTKEYKQAGNSWLELLNRINLLKREELLKTQAEQVQLLTLHAAKGLEFKAVFLPCLEDIIIPLNRERLYQDLDAQKRKSISPIDPAEEARLLYVGLTRSRQAVYASCAEKRRLFGRDYSMQPSSLLLTDLFSRVNLVKRIKKTSSQIQIGL